jgi:hypothetical protein
VRPCIVEHDLEGLIDYGPMLADHLIKALAPDHAPPGLIHIAAGLGAGGLAVDQDMEARWRAAGPGPSAMCGSRAWKRQAILPPTASGVVYSAPAVHRPVRLQAFSASSFGSR